MFWTSPLISLSEKVNKIKVYERNDLKGIRSQMSWTPGKFGLPPSPVFRIRSLELKPKWQKGHRGDVGRVQLPSNTVDINNNITGPMSDFHDGVKMQNECDTSGLRLGMANTRSVKNTDLMVARHMIDENIDAMVLTLTWLKQNEDDQLWKKATCLANQNFNLVSVERQTGHRGGGLALITKKHIKTNLIESRIMKTFECMVWNIKFKTKNFN